MDERKQKILDAIIRDFIHTAEPVGSRTIWRSHIHEYSPATIRNEMADLEEEGFIKQPHTSAGRIPTDLGYRYYVDKLMKSGHLSEREEELIKKTFGSLEKDLDEALHKTAKLVSELLDYTTLVVNLGSHHRVFSSGISKMLKMPEFKSATYMQRMLEILEEEDALSEMTQEYIKEGENIIKIGAENSFKKMKDCSVVMSSYEIEGEMRGGFGVIGPTRMHYNKVISVVKYIAKELSRIFRK